MLGDIFLQYKKVIADMKLLGITFAFYYCFVGGRIKD